jgi:hypothetical protein
MSRQQRLDEKGARVATMCITEGYIDIYVTYDTKDVRYATWILWIASWGRTLLLSREALQAWRQVWLDVGAWRSEPEMGLRLFDVGMGYLMTGDRRVLLDLLATERPLVCEALDLPLES